MRKRPCSCWIMVHFMASTHSCSWGCGVQRATSEREREGDGVRCDIDDKPVCLSLVSPWLNVRSQWKGGTTNVTESLWQLDPWERKYPFNQMSLLPVAHSFPNLPSTSFLLYFFSSCPIHLFLTFASLYTDSSTTNCFTLFVLSLFFLSSHTRTHIHTRAHIKIQKQTHSLLFPGSFLGLSI